ncbi:MAG: hypothetical protein JO222_09625 [Frankiales bacterium]|nr:hypothetical protein [Frankiales bacterium]
MNARALLQPVGPEPARVYWQRRVMVIGIVVIAAVVIAIVAGSVGSGGAHPSTTGRSQQPTPPAGSTAAGRAQPCGASSITVTASTDAAVYPGGAIPKLAVQVHNKGTAPCRLEVQTAARTWSVFSGNDQVWTTADCPRSDKVTAHRLPAGKSVSYSLSWDRSRSVPGCTHEGAAAQPGTYRLYVTVDGVHSAPAVFHLTK